LFPGETRADAKLQADVFLGGAMRLQVDRWRDPACRTVYVVDTAVEKVETTSGPDARGPAWHESWTVAACDRRQKVLVQFAPNPAGSGVAFAISLK
jgi:hypothetical protein